MIHLELKAMRIRTGMSIRSVAEALGFEQHSKYSYYESVRFKGPLPIGLARKLAKTWEYFGVEPYEVLQLAGFSQTEAIEDIAHDRALRHQPTLPMRVLFPSERALTRMFEGMFEALGSSDHGVRYASRLAQLLPIALGATPVGADEMEDSPAAPALVEELRSVATDDLSWP